MKSYIVTQKLKGHSNEKRYHIAAASIAEAARRAEDEADGLWEIVKIELLE